MANPRVYRCMNWFLQLCTICALSCLGAGQVTTGTLLGTVHDAANAAVQGASVTITNLQTGVSRSVLSGNEGEYILNLLPVGNYSVRVEHTGFRTEERPRSNCRSTAMCVWISSCRWVASPKRSM